MSSFSLPAVPSLADRVAAASTFSHLVDAIPLPYRDVLQVHLSNKYRIAHKHAALRRLCSSYQALLDRGSCPPSIAASIQPPSLRFSTSFLTTPEYTAGTASLQAALRTARQTFLAAVIAIRSDELASLSALLQPDFDSWNHLVTNAASSVAHAAGATLLQDDNRVFTLTGVSSDAHRDYVAILGACSLFTRKLLLLACTARSDDTRTFIHTESTSATLRFPISRLHPSKVRKSILKTPITAEANTSRSSSK